jgi:hypothetical protein
VGGAAGFVVPSHLGRRRSAAKFARGVPFGLCWVMA